MGQDKKGVRYDWLLGMPLTTWEGLEEWVDERLAADPEAAAISDDEAEAFFCAAYMVREMSPAFRATTSRAFGVRYSGSGPKSIRLSTLGILRKWKDAQLRNLLIYLIPNCSFGGIPIPASRPECWTDDFMRERYHKRLHLVWLVRIRRYLGRTEDLADWLESVSEWATEEYQIWLNVARLALRRIVHGEPTPAAQVAAAAAAPVSWDDLRQRDKAAGALRQDVRRMEQGRKELKQRARQAEKEAKAIRSQAQGEVLAARRALKERAVAHQQERAGLLRRFEHDLKLVRQQQEAAHQGFIQELSDSSRVKVLAGQRITVTDCGEAESLCRLLVESLGGTYHQEGGGVEVSAANGLEALEAALRSLALRQVLIKCDGLYRRKEGRHGVAVAALQVQAGGVVIYEETGVVHCGPLAGSLMAEYGAVTLALHWLLSAAPPPGAQVEIQTDCRTMVGRLRRSHGLERKQGCVTLDALVRRGLRTLQRRGVEVNLRWVPRDKVEVADRLCDRGYRELHWYHRRGSKLSVPLRNFLQSVAF